MAVAELPGVMLLCIDLQEGFLAAIPQREAVVRRCRFVISAARGLGVPVAFTEQVPQKLGTTLPELTALVEKPVQLAKSTFSALADDGIADFLRQREIEHLLLCGIETPICVYQTAVDALNANLQVTILSDAVAGRRAPDADVALAALARTGAHVLPAETVLYSLLHDAKHPFFKPFTQLVKAHA